MNHTVKSPALNKRLSNMVESPSRSRVIATSGGGPRWSFLSDVKKNWMLILMILPTIAYFVVQSYLPMVGVYLAFTRFDFAGGIFGSPFVGFENFKFLVGSGTLLHLTANTILYNIVFIATGSFFQISCAILLNEIGSSLFKRVSQSLMFLPYFISFVIVGAFSYNMFNYETGFLNTVVRGLGFEPMDVYAKPAAWPPIMVGFYLWKNLGYGIVIYLAALVGINREYYEAADIDGANAFQQIRHITLPLITPTFIILLLFSLGSIMRGQFDLFYQVVGNNGNLFAATDILDTYVYRTLRVNFDVGMGTAAGLYQSLFGFVIIMTVNKLIRRSHEEYALF